MGKKRNELPPNEKIEVIKEIRAGRSQREVAAIHAVSKSQIQRIASTQEALLEEWESFSLTSDRKRRQRPHIQEMDEKVWSWLCKATGKRIPVTGPLIRTQARLFAGEGGIAFSASIGWLESFRKRHNIDLRSFSGEEADVDGTVVADWREKLPDLIRGYDPKDIFNMDETAPFFRTLPNRSLVQRTAESRGGKKIKGRFSAIGYLEESESSLLQGHMRQTTRRLLGGK